LGTMRELNPQKRGLEASHQSTWYMVQGTARLRRAILIVLLHHFDQHKQ